MAFWVVLVNCCLFKISLGILLDHLCLFWVVLAAFGAFWVVLNRFSLFWVALARFGLL